LSGETSCDKQEEQTKEEETAEAVADEIAGELGAEAEAAAEDAALSVLEQGGSMEEATDAAEEAAVVRPQLTLTTGPEPRVCSV
jgi:hypothetical protein